MGISFSDFILNMKYYRTKRNISQAQLAEECDCSNGMIGAIEAGRAKPSFDMILSIATALKIHPADLFLRDSSITRRHKKYINRKFKGLDRKNRSSYEKRFFLKR